MALAIALSGAAAAASADHQRTYRSVVDVVRVDALITAAGHPVSGLTPADFDLMDNGVPQRIESVSLESLPLSVTIVLDTSSSVGGMKLTRLEEAVDLVLNRLRDADVASLITFSHQIRLARPLTSNPTAIRDAVHTSMVGGATALRDAVFTALALTNSEHGRPLVIAFSDGVDNASWLSDEAVEHAAERSTAVIYAVAVAESTVDGQARYAPGQTAFLETVAAATGGRVVRADTLDRVSTAFGEVLDEFRSRYVITYTPAGVPARGWHTIELKVKGRRAVVVSRPGYQR